MAKNEIKEYKPRYCEDDKGGHYKIKIQYKDQFVEVLLDLADYENFEKYNWSVLTVRGIPRYITRYLPSINGKRERQQLHQFIMDVKGSTPLDHINGNGFDCRRDNLRIATVSENARNSKKRKNTTSNYKGVCWKKRDKRWVVQIKYNEKTLYLGSYKAEVIDGIDVAEIKAARLYDKAAKKYFGTFAHLNIPEDRNIVTSIQGKHYRSHHLFNEEETKKIEASIKELMKFKSKEIMEILQAMNLKDIVDMCHYFGCGIEELTVEIRKGVVLTKKHA